MIRIIALALLAVLPVASAEISAKSTETATTVAEILPHEAYQHQQQGALLVDVRADDERTQGMAEGALGVPMETLSASAARHLPDLQATILLICRSGQRSKRVAAQLLQQGYTQVFSVQGGTLRWQDEGLPMTYPEP